MGTFSRDETFDVGEDSGSSVSRAYGAPNRFAGAIMKAMIDTQPATLTGEDERRIREAGLAAAIAK